MFGYIQPDKPYLFYKDEVLYKALYCGLCKAIGEGCGQMPRTALSYDMAFLSALLHNIKNANVKIEKRRCAFHLRSKPMARPDETTVMLGFVNTALAYYKLLDDREDGDARGGFAFLYRRGFRRAVKKHPALVEIIERQLEEQAKTERSGCAVIDMACEPTAVMMQKISDYVLGGYATEHTAGLCYDLGKWVYLADALDDYDKDVKKGRYNVLYNAYGCPTKAEAVEKGYGELTFIFDSLFADMRQRLAKIKFYYNHDLTDNIILRGIPIKTRRLFYGKCGEGKKEERLEDTQCKKGEGIYQNEQA